MSYVLRWYGRNEDVPVYLSRLGGFTPRQKDAERFESAADARYSKPSILFKGVGGPEDVTGYVVVRLVKKVTT